MKANPKILLIAGPTASGKSSRAVEEALLRGGEIISVDSRQVYRGLDIGTEKISKEEMRGVPHHLIDIRDPKETYSAGDFLHDATRLIQEIHARGKLPILAGGTHFYFDALLHGLPDAVPTDLAFRDSLDGIPSNELFAQIEKSDPERASMLDPKNRRRILRALEIIQAKGSVSKRRPRFNENRFTLSEAIGQNKVNSREYEFEWMVLNPAKDELVPRIERRLSEAMNKGLVEEVRRVREYVGDKRLNELGLEYRIIGEYLRGEHDESSLLPTLNSKLWQYARHQKKWLRKLLKD